MKKTIIQIPEIEEMYDAVIQNVLPDYGTGGIKFTHAIVTEGGKTLRMSGFPAISKNGVVGKGDMGIQVTQALDLVRLTVERAGGSWDDIVHLIFYFIDRKQFHEKGWPARWKFFKEHSKKGIWPCVTGVGVKELMHPDFLIEVDATAVFD
jgi:enamine deaminase RidA (YjgF/YER057c/UK114 family)